MKAYNIYNGYEKINKRPLTKEELDTALSKQYVYKYNEDDHTYTEIPAADIKVIKCTII